MLIPRTRGLALQGVQSWDMLVSSTLACLYACESLTEWERLQTCGTQILDAAHSTNADVEPALLTDLQQVRFLQSIFETVDLWLSLNAPRLVDCSRLGHALHLWTEQG